MRVSCRPRPVLHRGSGPLGAITGAASAPADFTFDTNEGASPFGTYAYASALGGNWTGGGSPNGGIPIAGLATGTWTFNLANSNYSVADFFTAGDDNSPFVVRFRGLPNDGSDKVPGTVTAIPEPETYALMLAGLGVMASSAVAVSRAEPVLGRDGPSGAVFIMGLAASTCNAGRGAPGSAIRRRQRRDAIGVKHTYQTAPATGHVQR